MGRLIIDRMSYRNHYMCSGEATSKTYLDDNDCMDSDCGSIDPIDEEGEIEATLAASASCPVASS